MQWVKNNFLQLSINKEIQLGVMSVRVCVCILVFGLLAISSFLLINLTYLDILNVLDLRENQQIEGIAVSIDTNINVVVDISKQSIQWIRNFIQNNKQNDDFVDQLINLNVENVMVSNTNTSGCKTCIFYKFLDKDYSTNTNFKFYLKVLAMSRPLLKQTFNYRFYKLPSDEIFDTISIACKTYDAVFYYPSSCVVIKSIIIRIMSRLWILL